MKTIRPELIRQRKRRIRQRLEDSSRHDREGFIEQFVRLPAQIIRSGRQLTVRLLGWTKSLNVFNRWLRFALE